MKLEPREAQKVIYHREAQRPNYGREAQKVIYHRNTVLAWRSPSILLGNCRNDEPKPFFHFLEQPPKPLSGTEMGLRARRATRKKLFSGKRTHFAWFTLRLRSG